MDADMFCHLLCRVLGRRRCMIQRCWYRQRCYGNHEHQLNIHQYLMIEEKRKKERKEKDQSKRQSELICFSVQIKHKICRNMKFSRQQRAQELSFEWSHLDFVQGQLFLPDKISRTVCDMKQTWSFYISATESQNISPSIYFRNCVKDHFRGS